MKKYLIILIVNIFCCNISFAEDSSNSPGSSGMSVGVNFDPYFLAPGLKLGYRINSYMGVHALVQYSSSDDASKIPAEESLVSSDIVKLLSGFSYDHVFASLVFDAYPLENGLKISAGLGYMNREFNIKKGSQEITNTNKMTIVAGVGYEGLFYEGFGYDIEGGVKIFDKALETAANKGKSDTVAVPAINIALTYSF